MIYLFTIPQTGEQIELVMTSKQVMRLLRKDGSWRLPDGRTAIRDYGAEHSGQKVGENRGYPYLCEASGVMPKQRQQAHEESVKAGCPTDFAPDGRAVIRDANHRRKYLKSIGLHDRNSYC